MAKRLNIGVDVDGVLSNFTLAARTLCKKLLNGKPADDLVQTSWGFDSIGITKKEEDRMWRTIDATPNWWLGHEPMPYTDFLPQLNDAHRLIFITNRKDGTGLPIEVQTKHWITNHFGIYNPTVVISDKKGPAAIGLNFHYFIDDRPRNVAEVMVESGTTKTYMLDATYNQDFVERVFLGGSVPGIIEVTGKDVQRVKNFDEFARIVMEAA